MSTGSLLVTHRRGFLVRALGFTAGGAALTVPVLAVSTPFERVQFHLQSLEAAFRDLYPGAPVAVRGTWTNPEHFVDPAKSNAFVIVVAGALARP